MQGECALSDRKKDCKGLPRERRRTELLRHGFLLEPKTNTHFEEMLGASRMKRANKRRCGTTECFTNLNRDQHIEALPFFLRVFGDVEQIENQLDRCMSDCIVVSELSAPDTAPLGVIEIICVGIKCCQRRIEHLRPDVDRGGSGCR